jgi:ribose/xylose/arabinose/galactoside ABC-type transport system permease subunit
VEEADIIEKDTTVVIRKRRADYVRRFGSLAILLLLSSVMCVLSPYFLSTGNIMNIIRQCSVIGLLGIGMTFVILTGGIDLSVGSVVAFSGCLVALLARKGYPVPAVLLICALLGVGFGAISGTLITRAKIPPFIVTLGMMYAVRGAVLTMTGGAPITGLPPFYRVLGSLNIGPVPLIAVIWLCIGLLGYVLLDHTRLGRHIYAAGGNQEAARFSGINVEAITTLTYILCAVCTCVAGLITVARLDSAQPVVGMGYELLGIAAVIVGGTSFFGGEGGIGGTLIGTLVFGVLQNGMNLLNVNTYTQQIVTGLVIVAVVFLDVQTRRGRRF